MTITRTREETSTGRGAGGGYCEGCPRCNNAQAGLCTTNHQEFGGRHPVCKACGHCVLRGKHIDDGADLDQYRGRMQPGFDTFSRN